MSNVTPIEAQKPPKRRKQHHPRPIKLEPTLRRALEELAASENYPLETLIAVLLCEALSHRLRQANAH